VLPPVTPDPAAHLALFGLTRVGSDAQVWLMDTTNGQREMAAPGGSAFGFTVASVGPDSVTLSRDGRQYVLRLGQKQLPVAGIPIVQPRVASVPARGAVPLRFRPLSTGTTLPVQGSILGSNTTGSIPGYERPETVPGLNEATVPPAAVQPGQSGFVDLGNGLAGFPVAGNGIPPGTMAVLTPDGVQYVTPDGQEFPATGQGGAPPAEFAPGIQVPAGGFGGIPGSETAPAARGILPYGQAFHSSQVPRFVPNTPMGPRANPQAARRQGQNFNTGGNFQTMQRRTATGRGR